jgi:hypothetical protein
MALRIIQWGTGAVGKEVLAGILDPRSGLELAGVRVYSDDKAGVDAGLLLGREPVGVTASADVGRVLEIDADCVVYTPRLTDLDEVCAILASGKNVVTTAFLFHPDRLPTADRDRLLAACHAGGVSVHGCGLNPGNLSGALPLALTGMSRTIDKLTLQERADRSVYDSTAITFDNMRFGQPVDEISVTANEFLAFNSSIFTEQVWLLADALNAGTTAGQRWNWVGRRDGEPLVEIETLWTVGNENPTHWPKPQHGWTLTIEGEPSMRTHFLSLASFERNATMLEHVNSAN